MRRLAGTYEVLWIEGAFVRSMARLDGREWRQLARKLRGFSLRTAGAAPARAATVADPARRQAGQAAVADRAGAPDPPGAAVAEARAAGGSPGSACQPSRRCWDGSESRRRSSTTRTATTSSRTSIATSSARTSAPWPRAATCPWRRPARWRMICARSAPSPCWSDTASTCRGSWGTPIRPRTSPALERPLVGYVGRVGDHMWQEAVVAVADRLERGTVVLVGDASTDLSALRHPRIRLLGRRPADVDAGVRGGVRLLPDPLHPRPPDRGGQPDQVARVPGSRASGRGHAASRGRGLRRRGGAGRHARSVRGGRARDPGRPAMPTARTSAPVVVRGWRGRRGMPPRPRSPDCWIR